MDSQQPVIESITTIMYWGRRIRVWRQEEWIQDEYTQTQYDIENKINGVMGAQAIIQAICTLPRINAIEIVHPDRATGIVYYTEWP